MNRAQQGLHRGVRIPYIDAKGSWCLKVFAEPVSTVFLDSWVMRLNAQSAHPAEKARLIKKWLHGCAEHLPKTPKEIGPSWLVLP